MQHSWLWMRIPVLQIPHHHPLKDGWTVISNPYGKNIRLSSPGSKGIRTPRSHGSRPGASGWLITRSIISAAVIGAAPIS